MNAEAWVAIIGAVLTTIGLIVTVIVVIRTKNKEKKEWEVNYEERLSLLEQEHRPDTKQEYLAMKEHISELLKDVHGIEQRCVTHENTLSTIGQMSTTISVMNTKLDAFFEGFKEMGNKQDRILQSISNHETRISLLEHSQQ
jgi:uncharacterized protein YoxC